MYCALYYFLLKQNTTNKSCKGIIEFFLMKTHSVEFYRIPQNLINQWSINWNQIKCSLCCLCLCGTLRTPLTRGSWFKYHFLQILNSVEFYRISWRKTQLKYLICVTLTSFHNRTEIYGFFSLKYITTNKDF